MSLRGKKNYAKDLQEVQEAMQKEQRNRKLADENRSLDEKIARANRDYMEKTANLDLYFVSPSEKNRRNRLTKKQKIKKRRRAERLGLDLDDQLDDDK